MDSYNDILKRMTDRYTQLSGTKPTEQSDIMLRMKVLSGEIYNLYVLSNFVKQQILPSTASGDYLDKHAIQRGIKRKEATKSTGFVTFSTSQPAFENIVISKGTVVSTLGPDAKRFVTDKDVTIKKGSSTATVSATAQNAGADHNVAKNTITVMVTPPVGVTSVTNQAMFSHGSDAETDEKLRERLLESYRDISNGTNAIYYKRLAESVDGIYTAGVIPRVRGNGTVNVYISEKGKRASANQIEAVQALIDENREINVDTEVLHAVPLNVSLTISLAVRDGYDFDVVSEQIKASLREYINSLGIGKPMLLSDIGERIYHTKGVKNYSFVNAFCKDYYPTEAQYCLCDSITIRR